MIPPSSSVVPLRESHDIGMFECGDSDIDSFLHERARGEQALELSQIYVTAGSSDEVLGYFTLSPVTVRIEPALLAHLAIEMVLPLRAVP